MLCNAVFNIAIGVMNQNKFASLSEFTAATEAMPPSQQKFGVKDLEDALTNFYLRVEYQPKVPFQLSHKARFGVEALCRIHHPDFGTVMPDNFIALAESSGLIGRLTDT